MNTKRIFTICGSWLAASLNATQYSGLDLVFLDQQNNVIPREFITYEKRQNGLITETIEIVHPIDAVETTRDALYNVGQEVIKAVFIKGGVNPLVLDREMVAMALKARVMTIAESQWNATEERIKQILKWIAGRTWQVAGDTPAIRQMLYGYQFEDEPDLGLLKWIATDLSVEVAGGGKQVTLNDLFGKKIGSHAIPNDLSRVRLRMEDCHAIVNSFSSTLSPRSTFVMIDDRGNDLNITSVLNDLQNVFRILYDGHSIIENLDIPGQSLNGKVCVSNKEDWLKLAKSTLVGNSNYIQRIFTTNYTRERTFDHWSNVKSLYSSMTNGVYDFYKKTFCTRLLQFRCRDDYTPRKYLTLQIKDCLPIAGTSNTLP